MPAPSLIWVLEPASGRVRRQDAEWGDRVCAATQSLEAAGGWAVAAGAGRAWAAAHLLCGELGTHGSVVAVRQGQVGDRGEGGVAEPDQGVTDPAGELAGHRQSGPVAIHPGLHLGVEVMVGRGRRAAPWAASNNAQRST